MDSSVRSSTGHRGKGKVSKKKDTRLTVILIEAWGNAPGKKDVFKMRAESPFHEYRVEMPQTCVPSPGALPQADITARLWRWIALGHTP